MSLLSKSKEPVKPATVPAEAVWVAADKEWELGKKNSKGKNIGEWKWWLAPTGHLVCQTFYTGDSGDDFTYTRFHPDGTVSRKGTYINGVAEGECVSIKSENPTDEYFNPKDGDGVWKAITTFEDGMVVKEYYYDKEGNEIKRPYLSAKYKSESTANEEFASVSTGPEGETAREALQRLENFLNILGDEEANESCMPVFLDEEIEPTAETEKRLGIKLPPSYKRFIEQYGYFKLGTDNENFSCLRNITRLADELESDWEVDLSEFSEQEQQNLRDTLCFSMGDEGLQLQWFYCFKLDTQNPETGEMEVVAYDQDEWEYLAEDSDSICEGNGFDRHIVSLVNEEISDLMENL